MAVEARPELVGKRFLCVGGDEPPEIGDIGRWPWRSGVIRAVNHLDSDNPDLTTRAALQPHAGLIPTVVWLSDDSGLILFGWFGESERHDDVSIGHSFLLDVLPTK
ncbi:putative JmjC domain-containing histone demethylation protein 2C [Liparis tanakae]|uniref:Putative JmjC domain-containing histone demethylation protein 2C n=1 Tax=Liparis tanakae TaxID=230148 RepID=A0A4Z2HC59_9TELE|nr:putative JmjC domain-containing histone demethylation protein 2C [Liparis tanakae]